MDSFLPPVIIQILANIKEFTAAKDDVIAGAKEMAAAGDTTSAKLMKVGNKAADFVLLGAASIGAVALKMGYEYGEALDTVGRQTNLNDAQLKRLGQTALTVSTATATSNKLILSGYQQLIKAGVPMAQATKDVADAARFSNAMGANLNDTLQATIDIQKMHIAGTNSMTQTTDIFTTAIKNSQLTAQGLTQALGGKALSAFAAYHIDLKTATTLLAGFADQGLNGTRAQMALKAGFVALDRPMYSANGQMSKTSLALANLHLNQQTLAEEARKPGGMLIVLSQIKKNFDEYATSAQKAQGITSFMTQVFGASAGPAFSNLLTELPQLVNIFNKMNGSKGATKSAFEQWLSTPGGVVKNFTTQVENVLTRAGMNVLPVLTSVIKGALNFADTQRGKMSDIIHGIEVAVGGAMLFKLATWGKSLVGTLGPIFKYLGTRFGGGTTPAPSGPGGTSTATDSENLATIAENTTKIAASTELTATEGGEEVAELSKLWLPTGAGGEPVPTGTPSEPTPSEPLPTTEELPAAGAGVLGNLLKGSSMEMLGPVMLGAQIMALLPGAIKNADKMFLQHKIALAGGLVDVKADNGDKYLVTLHQLTDVLKAEKAGRLSKQQADTVLANFQRQDKGGNFSRTFNLKAYVH